MRPYLLHFVGAEVTFIAAVVIFLIKMKSLLFLIACSRDTDGYYWITGRTDDLMNVSGHLLSTAQIESALIEHSSLAEAAVVGFPHSIKGTGIYCFVTLKNVSNFFMEFIWRKIFPYSTNMQIRKFFLKFVSRSSLCLFTFT